MVKGWLFWVFVAGVGLMMSVTVRIIAETTSGHVRDIQFLEGELHVLNSRLIQLEGKAHPATSKRFNSDDAMAMEKRIAECIDAKVPMKPCLESKK